MFVAFVVFYDYAYYGSAAAVFSRISVENNGIRLPDRTGTGPEAGLEHGRQPHPVLGFRVKGLGFTVDFRNFIVFFWAETLAH